MAKRAATIELDSAVRNAVAQCCPSVLASPLDATEAAQLALGFTALADPVRLQVLDAFVEGIDLRLFAAKEHVSTIMLQVLSILAAAPEGEVCVCDFVEPLGKSQPTVSHHMKILADAGLVHGERRSKWVYYSLDRGRLASLRATIDT